MTKMIKIAICDDETLMAKEISDHISKYMEEHKTTRYLVSSFSSGRSLLESGCDFDLIFLDIQMAHPNGMETAQILREQNHRSLLIFVTVLKECVFDAFALEAYDYLVKPLDSSHFQRTMDRAVKRLEKRTAKRIVIQQGASCQVVALSKIVYCEVLGRKLYIHQEDGTTIDYYASLGDFEQRVDGRFFKCHRSYLVNLDHVRGCRAGQVMLSQGGTIPVSRLREQDLTQALLRYMKERDF